MDRQLISFSSCFLFTSNKVSSCRTVECSGYPSLCLSLWPYLPFALSYNPKGLIANQRHRFFSCLRALPLVFPSDWNTLLIELPCPAPSHPTSQLKCYFIQNNLIPLGNPKMMISTRVWRGIWVAQSVQVLVFLIEACQSSSQKAPFPITCNLPGSLTSSDISFPCKGLGRHKPSQPDSLSSRIRAFLCAEHG